MVSDTWIPKVGSKVRLIDYYYSGNYSKGASPLVDYAKEHGNRFTIVSVNHQDETVRIKEIPDWNYRSSVFLPYNNKLKREISKHKPYINKLDNRAWRAIISK